MIPLCMFAAGDTVKIERVGGSGHLFKTLASLGIIAGEELKIIQITNDSVIVQVKSTRYALGRGAAGMILASNGVTK